jgi:hypothetical protein
MTVRDAKELLAIAKCLSKQIKGDKADSIRLECMNSLGVYTTTVTVGNVFSKWVQKLSKNNPRFPTTDVYNVRIHELKPIMREISSDVKREQDGEIIVDLKKCLDLEMFRLEVYYRMNPNSLNALVHSRSSPEPFKDEMKYHLSAQLIDPPSLVKGFSEVDIEDYPVEARIHIQEKIDLALPSIKTFKKIRRIETEMLSEYDPRKAFKMIQLQKERHALRTRLIKDNPIQSLRDLVIFLRPSKFLTYLKILEDFRLHECSWGARFLEIAGSISLPEEMVIMTRTDLNLKKPAAKGILEYHESAFSNDVRQILTK